MASMQRSSLPFLPAAACVALLGGQLFVPLLPSSRSINANALKEQAPGQQPGSPGFGFALAALGTSSLMLVAVTRRQRAAPRMSRTAFDPSTMPGATEPMGFFDPLGFTKGKDEANFRKLRVAETKHGRVAMMASIGTVLSHSVKLPGFEKVPAGLSAVTSGGLEGFLALVLFSGFMEIFVWKDDVTKEPGDFGDPSEFGKSMQIDRAYELNNGRMAMIAVLGQFAGELVSGKDAVEQFRVLFPLLFLGYPPM